MCTKSHYLKKRFQKISLLQAIQNGVRRLVKHADFNKLSQIDTTIIERFIWKIIKANLNIAFAWSGAPSKTLHRGPEESSYGPDFTGRLQSGADS